jgi:hypothetical protein
VIKRNQAGDVVTDGGADFNAGHKRKRNHSSGGSSTRT